jgi:hypothetical protein
MLVSNENCEKIESAVLLPRLLKVFRERDDFGGNFTGTPVSISGLDSSRKALIWRKVLSTSVRRCAMAEHFPNFF